MQWATEQWNLAGHWGDMIPESERYLSLNEITFLVEHVDAYNAGVRTGDWAPMLDLMTDDVVLEFTGIPVGPFHGRDAVGEAYRAMPPDDEIVLLDGGPAYAWAKEPAVPAGELHLEERDGRVARLLVVYGA